MRLSAFMRTVMSQSATDYCMLTLYPAPFQNSFVSSRSVCESSTVFLYFPYERLISFNVLLFFLSINLLSPQSYNSFILVLFQNF